ncbi:MAG: DUF308 domain-containing protein [Candidatus Nanopelagicales bacterium]|nr:DUF308 domain-containing protein [Candidatus Nanopelagicales bacterium]
MSTVNITTVDENDLVAAVSRNWWVLLFIGLVSLAVGIWAVVAPEKAFGTLSLIFAVWLLVTGIWQIVRAFASGLSGGARALFIITGALSLIIGFVSLRYFFNQDSIVLAGWVFSIFIGIGFLMRGFADLFGGISAAKGTPGRGWAIFAGIVILIGGIVILVSPLSVLALTWVVGIWLIVIGLFEIIGSFMVRKAA